MPKTGTRAKSAIVEGGPGPDSFRGRTRIERAVLPYLREQTLWPVLVAILAHVIALFAPLFVLAFRDGHRWSLFGVSVFGVLTLVVVALDARERRRPGLVAVFFALVVALCGLGAFALHHFKIV